MRVFFYTRIYICMDKIIQDICTDLIKFQILKNEVIFDGKKYNLLELREKKEEWPDLFLLACRAANLSAATVLTALKTYIYISLLDSVSLYPKLCKLCDLIRGQ